MFIQSKMIAVLVMICLGCFVVAEESENCVRVQFSFDDPNDINNNLNFTKQSLEKNGKPVYYTAGLEIQAIIWRNTENNKWLSKTRTYNGNKIMKPKKKHSHQNFILLNK